MTPFVGIHGSVYLARDEFDAAIKDVVRASIVLQSGVDTVSPLEALAIKLLHSSGHLSLQEDLQ
jgi:hypothetical protein